jgi:hypothetical protein
LTKFQQEETNQLEFQNFMLSAAEEDLLAGKIPQPQREPPRATFEERLPPPVQQRTAPASSAGFWTLDYWKVYFNVDTKDVFMIKTRL